MKSSIVEIVSLFGHSFVFNESSVSQRLYDCLQNLILQGASKFLVGTRGRFDSLALSVLRQLRQKYAHICICVVFTSLSFTKKDKNGYSRADSYKDAQTFMYEIEDEYFKNRITKSNQYMIDDSNIVVCYADTNARFSGAKNSLNYAKRKGKQLINIFDKKIDKYISKYLFSKNYIN